IPMENPELKKFAQGAIMGWNRYRNSNIDNDWHNQNLWIQTEEIWGAIFTLLASILITIISWIMIRINHWKDRMEKRFRYAARVYFERHNRENYLGLSLLSFTVVSREALEAFIFVAG
ncbi:6236_t:CDS:2, partial [Funneliformis mosseae]